MSHYVTEGSMTLGKKIKMRRVELDMTQAELARKAKMAHWSICRYEKNHAGMTLKSLVKLAKVLRVPMTYFFED